MISKSSRLFRMIEQQLENLAHFDDDLAYQYECDLYYEGGEPILELFTPELLNELERIVYELDND